MTVEQAHQIAHQVKGRVRQAVPSVSDVLVHVEPWIAGNSKSNVIQPREI